MSILTSGVFIKHLSEVVPAGPIQFVPQYLKWAKFILGFMSCGQQWIVLYSVLDKDIFSTIDLLPFSEKLDKYPHWLGFASALLTLVLGLSLHKIQLQVWKGLLSSEEVPLTFLLAWEETEAQSLQVLIWREETKAL